MKVSKKTLDEAIEKLRKYIYNTNKSHIRDDDMYDAFCVKCRDLSKMINRQFLPSDFYNIIWIYSKVNSTNETIYKAIELLGIEIE